MTSIFEKEMKKRYTRMLILRFLCIKDIVKLSCVSKTMRMICNDPKIKQMVDIVKYSRRDQWVDIGNDNCEIINHHDIDKKYHDVMDSANCYFSDIDIMSLYEEMTYNKYFARVYYNNGSRVVCSIEGVKNCRLIHTLGDYTINSEYYLLHMLCKMMEHQLCVPIEKVFVKQPNTERLVYVMTNINNNFVTESLIKCHVEKNTLMIRNILKALITFMDIYTKNALHVFFPIKLDGLRCIQVNDSIVIKMYDFTYKETDDDFTSEYELGDYLKIMIMEKIAQLRISFKTFIKEPTNTRRLKKAKTYKLYLRKFKRNIFEIIDEIFLVFNLKK